MTSSRQKFPGLDVLKNGRLPEGHESRVLVPAEVSDLATFRSKEFYAGTNTPETQGIREYAFHLGFYKGYEAARKGHATKTPAPGKKARGGQRKGR